MIDDEHEDISMEEPEMSDDGSSDDDRLSIVDSCIPQEGYRLKSGIDHQSTQESTNKVAQLNLTYNSHELHDSTIKIVLSTGFKLNVWTEL